MGWTVLYVAFGVVALWLLGEVLLQYKARLRWRLVAFFGFLGVVVGVVLPSVPVIAIGTVAFAVGQTFVTLSFRRGFSTGWALGGKPGTSRRRRERPPSEAMRPLDPVPDEAPADAAGYDGYAAGDTPVHGVDGGPPAAPPAAPADHHQDGQVPESPPQPPAYPPSPPEAEPYAEPYGDRHADPYAEPYGEPYGEPYETVAAGYGAAPAAEQPYADPYAAAAYAPQAGGEGYPPYPDPYAAGGTGPYPEYGPDGLPPEGFPPQDPVTGYPLEPQADQHPYAPWPAAEAHQPETYPETPPGGVWMPPQRDGGQPPQAAGYGYPQGEPYQQDQGYYFGNDQRY